MNILAVIFIGLVSTLRLFAHNDTEIDETINCTLESPLIGNNLSLSFRPMAPCDDNGTTVIWFRSGEQGNWRYWSDVLHSFLMPYEDVNQDGEHFQKCTPDGERNEDKACQMDIKNYQGMCSPAYEYGYRFGMPCVAIKVNTPDPYVYDDMPMNIPQEIRSKVMTEKAGRKVWITCEGENPADKENIGVVTYYPSDGGIAEYYFPFTNITGHLSPFVLVHFGDVKRNVLIYIECKAWAKNIVHSRMERKGLIRLELLVD